ncbi:MAG: reverse transcriptase domain-containing protein [Microcoleaceae cyanobacterium]
MGDEFLTIEVSRDRAEKEGVIAGTELSSQFEKIAPDLWVKFLSRENFDGAWNYLAKKRSGPGIDGVTVAKFEKDRDKNIMTLIQEIREGKYQPSPYKQLLIPKGQGKHREIKISTVRDRLVQKALESVLAPVLDKAFSPNSFAYRKGKSHHDAITLIEHLRDTGYLWGIKTDINKFFDEINHEKLTKVLQQQYPETSIISLIKRFLESPTIKESGEAIQAQKGLPQGGILSPLLSNVYLTNFDRSVEVGGIRLVRYSDDILLLSKSPGQNYNIIKNLLAGLDLSLKSEKSQEISFEEGFTFLGHQFNLIKSNETEPQSNNNNVRVPSRLFSHYGQCLKIWLFSRWLDQAFGQGSGKVSFSLFDAGTLLNRGESTIRKYLAQASKKGLIRSFATTKEGQCTVFYTSLEKAVQGAGMNELGPVASCPINRLEAVQVIATEIELAQLQKASFYAAKQAQKEEGKENPYKEIIPSMICPDDLLAPTCELPARVLGKTDRWIYTSEGFIPYGGSQKSVAIVRDITSRTVERHLSNNYRQSPSPKNKYREGLAPLLKGQIAQRVTRSRSKELLAAAKYFGEAGKFFQMGDRVFERKCNIYADFDFSLVRCRFRRRRLKIQICPPEREREKFLF